MMPASGDLVGRAPWPAADGGVRPTFWLRLCCFVRQDCILLAGFQLFPTGLFVLSRPSGDRHSH
jgi:hypothetical protein